MSACDIFNRIGLDFAVDKIKLLQKLYEPRKSFGAISLSFECRNVKKNASAEAPSLNPSLGLLLANFSHEQAPPPKTSAFSWKGADWSGPIPLSLSFVSLLQKRAEEEFIKVSVTLQGT